MPSSTTRSEALFAALIPAVVALQITLAGGWFLVSQAYRSDEFATHMLVDLPGIGNMLDALRRGADFNVPGLYLQLKAFCLPFGVNETSLRAWVLLGMVLGLVGVYATLRQSFSRTASLVAVLAVWAIPTPVEEAFNARFYGPWFGAVTWFAFALERVRTTGSVGATIAVAVTSVLTCTVHYFGVLSLALVCTGHLLAHRRVSWRAVVATACGPLALAACYPLYAGQQEVLTVGWIRERSFVDVLGILGALVPWIQILAIAGVVAIVRLRRAGDSPPPTSSGDHRAVIGLAGLALMPLVLLVFSWLVQPAMIPRYAIVTIAGFAPLVAWPVTGVSPAVRIGLAVAFVAMGTLQLGRVASEWRHSQHGKAGQILVLRQQPEHALIVFEAVQDMAPVLHYAPDLAPRCRHVDYEVGQILHNSRRREHSRDLARCYANVYPQYRLIDVDAVRKLNGFLLLPSDADVTDYAMFEWQHLGGRVFGMRRR